MFDESKKDWVDVYCFREEVPAEKQSASEIKGSWAWARPDNPSIVITVSAEGDVQMVEVRTDEVNGTIFDAGSYMEFDGAREPGGEESDPWRVSATRDVEVMPE